MVIKFEVLNQSRCMCEAFGTSTCMCIYALVTFQVKIWMYVQLLRLSTQTGMYIDYWFAPGARSHLHVSGVMGGGEMCL